jgi:Ribonuclease G/E
MVTANDPRFVGFLEINLGRTKVKVPIQEAQEGLGDKDAAFATDLSGAGVILVRDGASEKAVERAMSNAAREACKHFSQKLLN